MPGLSFDEGPKGSFMWRISPPLLLVLAAAGVAGLRNVTVVVPEAAAAGDTVALQCRYELEGDTLYSVKWYKGRQEFYRYIPKELPHTRVFALENVDVDVGRSGPATVVLRGVTPSLSGRYRCEVSADAPSFHTAMKTSYMHVVELPESAPIIFAEKNRVSVGDVLKVRCTAPAAHPPANLTWILNGKMVKGTPILLDQETKPAKKVHRVDTNYHTRRQINNKINDGFEDNQRGKVVEYVTVAYGQDEIETGKQGNDANLPEVAKKRSGSMLVVPITQDVFQQGQLSLICRATVFSLYSAEARLTLDEDKPQIALILGNKQSHSGATAATGNNSLAALAAFVVWLRHAAS